jgi:hypothetical protein
MHRAVAGPQVHYRKVSSSGVVVTDGYMGALRGQEHRRRVSLGFRTASVLGFVQTSIRVPVRTDDYGLWEVEELHTEPVLEERDRTSRWRRGHAPSQIRVTGHPVGDRRWSRPGLSSILREKRDCQDQQGRCCADYRRPPRGGRHPRKIHRV